MSKKNTTTVYIYLLRQYVAVEQPATNRRVHYIQPWPTTEEVLLSLTAVSTLTAPA